MGSSLHSLWRTNLFFLLGLLLHGGEALKLEAPTGPLYRVVGSLLSIPCNVTSTPMDDSRKDFEFFVKKPDKTTTDNIVSTIDPDFGYYAYKTRLRKKELAVKRQSANSVLFEIYSLVKSDEGEYECSVSNAGSAMTLVKVIDSTLNVSSSASTSLSYNEGDTFTSTCQAFSNTVQHVHLSVGWYLHRDGEENAQHIISLDKNLTLSPGLGFEGRYRTGHIRLDKTGGDMYKLSLAQLELSDAGRVFCRAKEWIQEPDKSWYTIAQKDSEETTLQVKARESQLSLEMQSDVSVKEGDRLKLTCKVLGHKGQLSITWQQQSSTIISLDWEGVVREEVGGRKLKVTRPAADTFVLELDEVTPSDSGAYRCAVIEWEYGRMTGSSSQTSSVKVTLAESLLSLEMQNEVSVNEGDGLKLTCKVLGHKGQLSIIWQQESTTIISLDQEGVLREELGGRKLKATRPAADTFVLELDEVTPSDSGAFHCAVSEWENGRMTSSRSQTATVTVTPAESQLSLEMESDVSVNEGDGLKLTCKVLGHKGQLSIIWQRQSITIASLDQEGVLRVVGDRKLTATRPAADTFILELDEVTPSDSGVYRCAATEWENSRMTSSRSQTATVKVTPAVSVMKVSLKSRNTMVTVGEDVELICNIKSVNVPITVKWIILCDPSTMKNIMTVSSDGTIQWSKDHCQDQSRYQRPYQQHYQLMVSRSQNDFLYRLLINGAGHMEAGTYRCDVLHNAIRNVSNIVAVQVRDPESKLTLGSSQPLTAIIHTDVQIKCSVKTMSTALSRFSVTWYLQQGAKRKIVLSSDVDAQVTFGPETDLSQKQRISMRRTKSQSFELDIRQTWISDSGMYSCEIAEWFQDPERKWRQLPLVIETTNLTVVEPEKKLSVVKKDEKRNVSRSEDFTIHCNILEHSSSESQFQLTWFQQKEAESEQRPVFTAYRNSTLRDWFGKEHLRFDHPSSTQFSLTVSGHGPKFEGLYFCEVEEWLPSPSQGWRRFATDKSGILTIYMLKEGDVSTLSEPNCKLGTWIWILVAFIICALLVILVLVLKIFKSKVPGGKKSGESLWAEQPLNTKPTAID